MLFSEGGTAKNEKIILRIFSPIGNSVFKGGPGACPPVYKCTAYKGGPGACPRFGRLG